MSNEDLADRIIDLFVARLVDFPQSGAFRWLERQRQELKAKVVALLAPRVEQSPELRPDVWRIVAAWIKQHGYDGLHNDGCGCALDDLMPCSEPSPRCKPGYRCWMAEEECWGIGPERGEKPKEGPTDGD